jgi:cardiolipin synthase
MGSRRSWIAVVPNVLSSLRLACAAAFPLVPPGWRLVLVLFGGGSDVADGMIARRFGVGSATGAILDAVADKLMVVSVLVTLAAEGRIGWWQVGLVMARDFAVAAAAGYTAAVRRWRRFRDMLPRWTGKLTTLLVFTWFVTLLVAPLAPIERQAFWAAAAASVLAAADYLVQFGRALRQSTT